MIRRNYDITLSNVECAAAKWKRYVFRTNTVTGVNQTDMYDLSCLFSIRK